MLSSLIVPLLITQSGFANDISYQYTLNSFEANNKIFDGTCSCFYGNLNFYVHFEDYNEKVFTWFPCKLVFDGVNYVFFSSVLNSTFFGQTFNAFNQYNSLNYREKFSFDAKGFYRNCSIA